MRGGERGRAGNSPSESDTGVTTDKLADGRFKYSEKCEIPQG